MAAAAILTRTSITELIMPMARRIRVCATVARAQCAAARFDVSASRKMSTYTSTRSIQTIHYSRRAHKLRRLRD